MNVHTPHQWATRVVQRLHSYEEQASEKLRSTALECVKYKILFTTRKTTLVANTKDSCDLHRDTNASIPLQRAEHEKFKEAPMPLPEQQSTIALSENTKGPFNTGSASAKNSAFQSGLTTSRSPVKPESLDYSLDCAPTRDTTRDDEETSSKRSQTSLRPWCLPTRPSGRPESTTLIRNMSSWLRATSALTVRSTEKNRLLLPCCSNSDASFG